MQAPVTQQAQSLNTAPQGIQPVVYQPQGIQPVMYQPVSTGPTQVTGPQITQNQMSANTNVTVNDAMRAKRQWSSGVFGCFEDFGTCCMVFFCCPCMESYIANEMEESPCLCCLVPGSVIALRTKMRSDQFIRGSILKDCGVVSCCRCCALCQLKREHDLITKLKVQKRLNMANQI